MGLRKIVFPFKEKNAHLNKYWWHRLLVVIFFIALVWVWIGTAYSVNYDNNWPYMDCLTWANSFTAGQGLSAPQFDMNQADSQCEKESPPVGDWEGILYGTVAAIGFYYLVQLIYFSVIYPIFRYIITGRRKEF
jgi:RsiW-degrading membrane proteinase PrsW (M82 family)